MALSTPDLCDQYGDTVQVAEPVFRHYGKVRAFSGKAVTVKCFEDNSKVGELLRTRGDGCVLVVDGGGSNRKSLLGDNLAASALENGWNGVVIFGYLRDVGVLAGLDLGVLAMGAIPRKTEKRGEGQVDIPVSFAGVTVKPGDFIYADESGLIVAPRDLVF